MIFRLFCISSITLLYYAGMTNAQGIKWDDIKAKAIYDWNSLCDKFQSTRVDCKMEAYFSRNHQPLRLIRKDYYKQVIRKGRGYSGEVEMEDFVEENVSNRKFFMLKLINNYYSAELSRLKADDGLFLKELKMGRDKDTFAYIAKISTLLPWLRICDGAVLIPEWICDPSFHSIKIEELPKNANNAPLRVCFIHDKPRRKTTDLSDFIQSGYIDFDARQHYRVMGFKIYWKDKISDGERQGLMEYEPREDVPILKRFVEEWPLQHSKKKGIMSSKNIWSYNYTYNSDPKDNEFRISFYGLPEPMGAPRIPQSRNWIWILAVSVGMAGLAMLFAWLKRRRAARLAK